MLAPYATEKAAGFLTYVELLRAYEARFYPRRFVVVIIAWSTELLRKLFYVGGLKGLFA